MSDLITEEWHAFQRPEDEGSNYWRIRMQDGLDSLHGYCGEERARLAAAAPDLLAALKSMLFEAAMSDDGESDYLEVTRSVANKARAAIAKVERRPAK